MSDFKAKMHQILFWLGSLQRSPDPLTGLMGPTSKGKGGGWEEWKGAVGEGNVLDSLFPLVKVHYNIALLKV